MIKGKKVGFIGGGNMCEAIFSGALASGVLDATDIVVVDVLPERLKQLAEKYGVAVVQSDSQNLGARQVAATSDIVVLAVKPQFSKAILKDIGGDFRESTTVISIIGGMTLKSLEEFMPQSPVLRVMPNTPMLVGKGCAAITPGVRATGENIALCRELFDAVGTSLLLNENLLNPFTAVGGCGPAFAYMFIEALADGGVEQGLPRELAQRTAAQMLAGAAEMVLKTGQHPGQLKDSVCSPGGGTIVGVHALEDGAFRATVMNAVEKSRQKMDDLGK